MSKTPGLIVPSFLCDNERTGEKLRFVTDSKDNDWCKRQKVIDEFPEKTDLNKTYCKPTPVS
jgi:hypothetical protein